MSSSGEGLRCVACGHDLSGGRFCAHCGRAVPAAVSGDVRATAERPAIRAPLSPTPPTSSVEPDRELAPLVHGLPRPARFPLYADEVAPVPRTPPSAPQAPATPAAPVAPTPDVVADEVEQSGPILLRAAGSGRSDDGTSGRRRTGLAWAAGALAAIVLLGAGGFWLLDGSTDPEPAADAPTVARDGSGTDGSTRPRRTGAGQADPQETRAERRAEREARQTRRAEREARQERRRDRQQGRDPVDVARTATATTPASAAPSRDVQGDVVRYEPSYLLDGQRDTAWRTPGDATGGDIVLELASPATISSVGLINGYAKIERGYDGYAANRRITAVEWVFDDGTVVPQSLDDGTTALQSIEVDDVTTTTVRLRIVAVTAPARGAAGRDYTAISDVALLGVRS